MELSILIPANNEMFLARTIEDILLHREADIEVIAVLDGKWSDPVIPQNDKVNVIYVPESTGQRAATNIAAKLAKGKYIMKCDAHCSFEQGFDRKMLEAFKETGDNVTMVPTMRNLWAFSWKCSHCGWKKYQGPTPTKCDHCGSHCKEKDRIYRKMMWVGKERPQSNSYSFDSEPHFAYNNELTKRKGYEKGIIIGYNLSVSPSPLATNLLEQVGSFTISGLQPPFLSSIVSLLTDLASSHQFTSFTDGSGVGKDMPVDTVGFSLVDGGGSIGTEKILGVGNKLEMGGVTTTPILAEMVNNRDILTPTSGDRADEPSINNPVCKGFLSEISAPTISPLIYPPFPIPTAGSVINSDVIQKFNNILGGEFIYNEKTSSFHNGSVALTPVYDKGITETMSLQGSCYMMTRERYLEYMPIREQFGSWGNEGLEIACREWLSGGRVLVNHKTWYAHMFRTQGGDFGFPYEQHGRVVQKTKEKVWEFFTNGKWDKQIHPVSWLIEKFWPVPGWTNEAIKKLKEGEILKT